MANRDTIKHTQHFNNKQLFKGDDDTELENFDDDRLSSDEEENFFKMSKSISNKSMNKFKNIKAFSSESKTAKNEGETPYRGMFVLN